MAVSAAQGTYEIRPNAFGGYEVFIEFSNGDVRRQGRFSTEEKAQAWVQGHKGWHMVRRFPPQPPMGFQRDSAAA